MRHCPTQRPGLAQARFKIRYGGGWWLDISMSGRTRRAVRCALGFEHSGRVHLFRSLWVLAIRQWSVRRPRGLVIKWCVVVLLGVS